MSESLDLRKLRARALLMRWSTRDPNLICRTPKIDEVEFENRTTKIIELAYYVAHGTWAETPESLKPSCRTPGCLVHLEFEEEEDADLQMVADRRNTRSLADMFRYGRSRGWFKGGSSYAN